MELEKLHKLPLNVGLLAHVDAGKTTLSEALLYLSGARRTLGRVDHRDSFLDTFALERERGITVFSKQARLETPHRAVTLVDTPGHADLVAEAEQVMPVLDCAVLIISAGDGVQSHTVTLWKLMEHYGVPVLLFVNKTDLPGPSREEILRQLTSRLSSGIVAADSPSFAENAALCDEAALEAYLSDGTLPDSTVCSLLTERKLFPCFFGSALKLEGVEALLDFLDRFSPRKQYPSDFGGRIYKISRDPQGSRLSWLKVTGGALPVRTALTYTGDDGEEHTEKISEIRLYSGEKFTSVQEAEAGQLCAVTGLSAAADGTGLGSASGGSSPVSRNILRYRAEFPEGQDPALLYPKIRKLAEEFRITACWDSTAREIRLILAGSLQAELFCRAASEALGLPVQLTDPRVCYRETILSPAEGVGHFEPLRHYAEVHILLEPLPRGSGLQYATVCPTDVLDLSWQRLILSHMKEKEHLGVLTGSPVTDLKMTLLIGKAHLKHTQSGDFRQAVCRAVRQGLMQAQSQLLEPWYRFRLRVPQAQIGRAITDIRTMSGTWEQPETEGEFSLLEGTVPVSEAGDYAMTVASYTRGRGRLELAPDGYAPCHNARTVIENAHYDPESDPDNTPDSVFCAHGAGFHVEWNRVKDYMHLESPLKIKKPELIVKNLRIDDKELEAIMEREFGPIRRPLYKEAENRPAAETVPVAPPRQQCLIVDGYNMIFGWDSLKNLAKEDLDAARRKLMDTLSSYAGFRKYRLILVFDGYKQPGPGEKFLFHNIQVVYTREQQTADAYIEALAAEIGSNYAVRVVTSDNLIQLSSFRSGVLRMSARELEESVETAETEMQKHFRKGPGVK